MIESTDEWPDVCFYDIDDDRIMAPAESRRLSQSSIPNGIELCNLLRTAKERFASLRTTGKPWYEMSGTFALLNANLRVTGVLVIEAPDVLYLPR